jgi:hypothetical protein
VQDCGYSFEPDWPFGAPRHADMQTAGARDEDGKELASH